MRVVSNTSPISNLAIIDRLDLLYRRYTTVSIPGIVADELAGWIPSVRDEIIHLRHEAGFFVDATVESYILEQVGEG